MRLLVRSVHKEMVPLGVMETVFGRIMSALKLEITMIDQLDLFAATQVT